MILVDDKRKWVTACWIIGALLLPAYNALYLCSLYDLYHVGYSDDVQLASSKWRQYKERRTAAESQSFESEPGLVVAKFFPGPVGQVADAFDKHTETGISAEKKGSGQSKLPILTGILSLTDIEGHRRLYAVIEGVTYTVKSRVQGYIIDTITEKGVAFSRNGKQHFVPGPQVYYSVDHSG